MLYLPQAIRRPLGKVRRAVGATHRYVAAPWRYIATPWEFRSARTALLAWSGMRAPEKEMLRNVSLRISMADTMYVPGEAQAYLCAGLSALRCITRVLDHLKTDRRSIRSVLDLPSGGGRVLRFMQIVFPDAVLVACDTDEALIGFCGKAFGVRIARSVSDFDKLYINGTFDLIWCGSLLTHIDETRCADLLRWFYNHLSPGGICIFSTHGATAISWLQSGERDYGLSRRAKESLLSQITESGFGYVNYDGANAYGVFMVERDQMIAMAEKVGKWSMAAFLESSWHNVQDVYAFTKFDTAPLMIECDIRPNNEIDFRYPTWPGERSVSPI